MARYNIKTTVDITRSNPDRAEIDQIKQAQQSNFNTLLQGIGMRSNVDWDHDPERTDEAGVAIWVWTFDAERDDVFLEGDDPVGLLKKDLHGIPIIKNLTETVRFDKPVFMTINGDQNIWISAE
jgi:hypothetical protein